MATQASSSSTSTGPFLSGVAHFLELIDSNYAHATTLSANSDFALWFQTDQLVVSYLTSIIFKLILLLIIGKTYSRAIWECLHAHFSWILLPMPPISSFNSWHLQRAHMPSRTTKFIVDSLTAINQPIFNIDLVSSVLKGLGPDNSMCVTPVINSHLLL
ncbi:hypothetical protein DVH24_014308 [Malus domestica]|uniref:Uncharacterized protein n=1 Tax=Malus domestica TaxID=3750 RepID=A0A498JJ52_MALDO|nr:hypothetical protein DVH24_014308 [Malus domestica]